MDNSIILKTQALCTIQYRELQQKCNKSKTVFCNPVDVILIAFSVKSATQIYRARKTLHSLRKSEDNQRGLIDVFLLRDLRVMKTIRPSKPYEKSIECNKARWPVRKISNAIIFSYLQHIHLFKHTELMLTNCCLYKIPNTLAIRLLSSTCKI
jgi:hypothetical protein